MENRAKEIIIFKRQVRLYFRKYKRSFPWRETSNPYYILVSEIMLQQTQADRVVQKYNSFLKKFPTIKNLAKSSLKDVLVGWQGLGYNRRAKALWETAKIITVIFNGKVPSSIEELEKLPGIGPYTARAILAFAYNKPTVFIETNIRTVYIHSFFKNKKNINDKDLFPFIEKTLDRREPKEWYQALMDYGAMLKKNYPNPNRKSKHYTKQSKFAGSDRQLRGQILKLFLTEKKLTPIKAAKKLDAEMVRVMYVLKDLTRERFLIQSKYTFTLLQ